MRRVEIPIAFPVILAGIRVSAVQIVATATLAAIVGGGTLGDFIVQGIFVRALDRVVGAAILVALLAIMVELAFSLLERVSVSPGVRRLRRRSGCAIERSPRSSRYTTPRAEPDTRRDTYPSRGHLDPAVDCRPPASAEPGSAMHRRRDPMRINRTLALGAATLVLVLSACSPGEGSQSSRQAASQPTCRRCPWAPPASRRRPWWPRSTPRPSRQTASPSSATWSSVSVPRSARRSTAARSTWHPTTSAASQACLEAEISSDAEETHANLVAALEEIGQTALDFSPGTDADGFAVRSETAEELSLENMTDLAGVADQLVWGLASGCPENPVCGPGLNDVYGIDIATLDTESLDPCGAEIAEALNEGAIDVAQVCTTQAEIASFNFVLMEDDRRSGAGSEPRAGADPGAGRRRWGRPGQRRSTRSASC